MLTNILRLKPDTAPGPDGIPNRVLKACSETLTELLTPLFQACVNLGYHPRAFRTAHTITLKKAGKDNYETPKAYRPIALLNTLGKVMEAIMASKITHMAEKHELLPGTQMGARRERSTESALELLTEQIHTVWGQGNDKVATLLSMDVAGAYDTVSHQRLIHNLRRRKIPQWVTNWIECFLKNRRTTLTINRRTTDEFDARTGIPQGSPISPILYLFYNADLLDICNRPGTKTSGLGFVDDINVLAYGKSTQEYCRTLERIHRECERWALRHGSLFAPTKYELIHLSRNPKKFDMTATINIENSLIKPKADIRILGLQIDTKLKWGAHIRKTQEKMVKQSMALTKISTSTWGASFARARQVYTAVVRPAMTYGSIVWHTPKDVNRNKSITSNLAVIQNRCLRTVAGAFKATPIPVLEAETHIAPIDVYLDQLQAKARYRLRITGQKALANSACKIIANKLRERAGRRKTPPPTPGELKHTWAKAILNGEAAVRLPPSAPPWYEASPEYLKELREARTAQRAHHTRLMEHHMKIWKSTWATYQNRIPLPTEAQQASLDKKRLKIHSNLAKAESSLATQIRTEKIGLANFLFNRRVPNVNSPACICGWPRQTAKHVIMHCQLIDGRNELFNQVKTNNYRTIIENSAKLKKLTAWLMRADILKQFSIAATMLYG